VGQTISIDPKMWATIRKLAFDRQTTASKIVETALTEWQNRENGGNKPRAGLATVKDYTPPVKPIARVVAVEEDERGVTVTAMPWDEQPTATITVEDVEKLDKATAAAPAHRTVIEDGQYKLSPEAMARRAAQLAAQKGREFNPVPKPVRKPRPKR